MCKFFIPKFQHLSSDIKQDLDFRIVFDKMLQESSCRFALAVNSLGTLVIVILRQQEMSQNEHICTENKVGVFLDD